MCFWLYAVHPLTFIYISLFDNLYLTTCFQKHTVGRVEEFEDL